MRKSWNLGKIGSALDAGVYDIEHVRNFSWTLVCVAKIGHFVFHVECVSFPDMYHLLLTTSIELNDLYLEFQLGDKSRVINYKARLTGPPILQTWVIFRACSKILCEKFFF